MRGKGIFVFNDSNEGAINRSEVGIVMGFVGILGDEVCQQEDKKSIFQDFNLDVCISRMNSLSKGYDLQELLTNMPQKPETIRYRRQITKDMQSKEVRGAFARYAKRMERAIKQEKQSKYNHHLPQQQKWHVDALCTYADAVEELFGALSGCTELSEELLSLVKYLDEYISSEEYGNWRLILKEVCEKLNNRSVVFSLQKNKVVLEEQGEYEEFGKRMLRAFSVKEEAENRFTKNDTDTLSLLERILAERIMKQSDLTKPMQRLMEVSIDEPLLQLVTDVQYYLGFYKFADELKERGYVFSLPTEGKHMSIRAGYDVAMAAKGEREVISNDFSMSGEERFFVITGANGGGKTTYARMIGQILYFFRMGFLVPCEQAEIPYFTDVLSHFSNEETEASGRGKLVEELVRLQPMMKEHNENCFVILNELFTTAATLDAGIMGKKVLSHFMQMNCRGIYVTHIQSLAEERDGVVSMVAELEEDHHTRSFKIVRKPAQEGEYEDSLITKYHMTYEQMKEVMGHGDSLFSGK